MAPLRNLHNRLYSNKDEELIKREKSKDEYGMDKEDNQQQKNDRIEKGIKKKIELNSSLPKSNKFSLANKKSFKIVAIFIAIVLILSAIIIVFVRFKQINFSQENVKVEFSGSQETRSGDSFEYKLLIKNKNRVALKNTKIKIKYPKELLPIGIANFKKETKDTFSIDVGDIKAGEIKEYPLKFNVFSTKGSEIYLNTDFTYEPSSFSSFFKREDNHSINISGSIIDFSLVSQQEVVSGEVLKLIGIITNNTELDSGNLVLKIDYPENFDFSNSELEEVSGYDNIFKIPDLKSGEKMEVGILGVFSGEVNSVQKLTGTIGVINGEDEFLGIALAEESVKVIPSRIFIGQELISGFDDDGQTTSLGRTLRYKINFKNNADNPLTDLVLKAKIDTDLIDHSTVKANNGYYDQEHQEIIWRASDIDILKQLNPNESGSVDFAFKLKDNFYLEEDDYNKSIFTQASIGSMNVNTSLIGNREINSERKEVKMNSNFRVWVSGEFDSDVFKNSGPIPVEVGEETTFTLKIELKNNFNKIEKPSLTIKLPSGIIWKDRFHRSAGAVNFNERNNELSWELDSVDHHIGYGNPLEELVFQIGLTPQPNQDQNIVLINTINVQGFETFVNKKINKDLKEFKLHQLEDYEFRN